MNLPKVQWRDGDVITEKHFRELERWSENSLAVLARQLPGYGLTRVIHSVETWNDCSSISIRNLQGTMYQVTLKNFQGVTAKGRILSVTETRKFDVRLPGTERDSEGYFALYLIPVDNDTYSPQLEEVTEGVVLYEHPCEIQASDPTQDGLCILRVKVEGTTPNVDRGFVPLCFTIGASPQSVELFNDVYQRYDRLLERLKNYVMKISGTKELETVWHCTTEMYRVLVRQKAVMGNPIQLSQIYFTAAQLMFDAVTAEIEILNGLYKKKHDLNEEIPSVLNNISRPILPLNQDMRNAYTLMQEGLVKVLRLCDFLPEIEGSLDFLGIRDVIFSKGTPYNKLVIHLEKQLKYAREKMKLIIMLRDFTRHQPADRDLRLSGVDMPWGALDVLRGVLTSMNGEETSFRIEYNGEFRGSQDIKQLFLFLPPPLGENVDNIKSKVTVSTESHGR